MLVKMTEKKDKVDKSAGGLEKGKKKGRQRKGDPFSFSGCILTFELKS